MYLYSVLYKIRKLAKHLRRYYVVSKIHPEYTVTDILKAYLYFIVCFY